MFLTAAFTGLRLGELLALRWRDVDFAGEAIRVRRSFTAHGGMSTPKSGRVRSVPMVPAVAQAIAGLADRERSTGDEDLIFPGITGAPQDGNSLRKRYKKALAAAGCGRCASTTCVTRSARSRSRRAEVPAVQVWMGHANIQTTMRYIHYRDRGAEARLLAEAFKVESPTDSSSTIHASIDSVRKRW